jgi:hypothetical protein
MDQKELQESAEYYLARLGDDAHALDSLTEVDRCIVPILIEALRSETRS